MAGCRGPLARNGPNLCSSECRAQWKIPGDETETFPKARNQFRDFIIWNYSRDFVGVDPSTIVDIFSNELVLYHLARRLDVRLERNGDVSSQFRVY